MEGGRPDWLATACWVALSCDMRVISGHRAGHNAVFSDRLAAQDFLLVEEIERASCSAGSRSSRTSSPSAAKLKAAPR